MQGERVQLEYAAPLKSGRGGPTLDGVLICGAVLGSLSVALPFDLGSGRLIVNPLRVLGSALAVSCVLAYAVVRLWRDRGRGRTRAVVYALCIAGSVAAFVDGHFSVWGRNRLPPASFDYRYWRSMAVASACVGAAVAFAAVEWVVRHAAASRRTS